LRAKPKLVAAVSLFCSVLGLLGCNSASPPPPAAVEAPEESSSAGVVGSVIGQSLDEKDKEIAIAAQHEAVNSGARKSWRGLHGSYGFVEPGSDGPSGSGCKEYTHKIFIDGRPQEAKGRACRSADGVWRVTS
jgi:surface antigen